MLRRTFTISVPEQTIWRVKQKKFLHIYVDLYHKIRDSPIICNQNTVETHTHTQNSSKKVRRTISQVYEFSTDN